MSQLPDFCQTEIQRVNYFTCLLPVTAFGFDDDMIMELSVEYRKSVDGTHLQAIVWVRQERAHAKHLIYSLSVPTSPEPDEAIFEALNDREEFTDCMRSYIREAAKQ